MKRHSEVAYRIMAAENGVDRDTLEHCRRCSACRAALYRKFRQEERMIPSGLDRATLARCRQVRPVRFPGMKKAFACSAAAVFLLCFAAGLFLRHGNGTEAMPERTEAVLSVEEAFPNDATGEDLFLELSEVRLALNDISLELSADPGQTAE